jgi:N-methylhydantoinase B
MAVDPMVAGNEVETNGLEWDGKTLPYRPDGRELNISPKLKLYEHEHVDLDPVTFEVLSTKLWNINEEHAETIKRASGSPVVAFHDDFNTCIMTADGGPFLFAPYIQYFAGNAEYIIKYTLENRAGNVEIQEGDMFAHNDCFIAGSHQQDIAIYAPVFVDGELFCWTFNACHVRDIGGVEPGSFCVQAPDVYWDPPCVSAMKIWDKNGLREDAYDTLLRFSRLPHLLAMELRSQVAGITRSRMRIAELVERYGPDVVRSVMSKTIDDCADALKGRLASIPDGKWSETTYVSGAFPGDTEPHKAVLTLEKRDGELFFTNDGTDPQIGALNSSFGQWRSAIGSALAQMLAYDHRFVIAGVHRVTHFTPQVGTITAIDRNGATSCLWAQVVSIYVAGKLLSKMIYPDEELRKSIVSSSPMCGCGWLTHAGIDQRGDEFSTVMLDHVGGGLGAFSFRDGIDQGGPTFWPKLQITDVEAWEQYFPLLFLYREGARNGGHGKYRGGHGLRIAWVGHGTERQTATLVSQNPRLTTQFGINGGHWANTGDFLHVEGSNIRAEFATGKLPGTPEQVRELDGKHSMLAAKAIHVPFGESDVIEHITFGGGGYGDPLQRDPQLVAKDLRAGDVTAAAGEHVYGVLFDSEGSVDGSGTEQLRKKMHADRLSTAKAGAPGKSPSGELRRVGDVAEALWAGVDESGDHFLSCSCCDTTICGIEQNYKEHSSCIETSLAAVDPEMFGSIEDPAHELTEETAYRIYICPSCAVAFENELSLKSAPPIWDIAIDPSTLSALAPHARD